MSLQKAELAIDSLRQPMVAHCGQSITDQTPDWANSQALTGYREEPHPTEAIDYLRTPFPHLWKTNIAFKIKKLDNLGSKK